MSVIDGRDCIRIDFEGFGNLEHKPGEAPRAHETYTTSHGEVVVTWEWESQTFRMDITAPQSVALDIALPLRASTVYVNGQRVWDNSVFQENTAGVTKVEELPGELRVACRSGGAYHVLACAEECNHG